VKIVKKTNNKNKKIAQNKRTGTITQRDINDIGCKSCSTADSDGNVEIRSDAFAFCRYGLMVLVWLGFFLRLEWLILVVFVILALSALFSVRFAPMILLYEYTVGKFVQSRTEKLGVGGMRFAHILGTVFSGLAVLFLYFWNVKIGWVITFFLAIMKTISAFGLCPAYKVYNCMKSGGCCSFTKKLSK
jgi:hypothetical protein